MIDSAQKHARTQTHTVSLTHSTLASSTRTLHERIQKPAPSVPVEFELARPARSESRTNRVDDIRLCDLILAQAPVQVRGDPNRSERTPLGEDVLRIKHRARCVPSVEFKRPTPLCARSRAPCTRARRERDSWRGDEDARRTKYAAFDARCRVACASCARRRLPPRAQRACPGGEF